ncbi:hypothetical protein [Clostridium chromiireducens]|uniref:Uncharacterized protein n=1 Tax=Clostridium chromiireducens TaxID=225345 RepID=A0A1V4IHF8_9CLOT|nr:hypothetical protein [Clostridium chromiireducens]OPJ59254.1 hypothetical protein CLCHR_35670 [Clostridium chromiireducens]
MKENKVWDIIFYSMGAISIIILSLFIFVAYSFSESYSSPFNKLNKNDYQSFQEIGNQIFNLYDEGDLKDEDVINVTNNYKVKDILSKYQSTVTTVYIVNKDVILISFGAIFQSIDGIAIRRNNAELKNTYKITGFDKGTLNYCELIPNVYHFNAGV